MQEEALGDEGSVPTFFLPEGSCTRIHPTFILPEGGSQHVSTRAHPPHMHTPGKTSHTVFCGPEGCGMRPARRWEL